MNLELKSLISLQELDLKIMDLEKKKSDIPQQIALLNENLRKHETEVNKVKEKLTTIQKDRRKLEGDVEMLRTKLSKYKDQLMEVKTNKEYGAVLKEIEVCKNEIGTTEDKILELMEQTDLVEKEQKQKESELRVEKEKTTTQEKELEKAAAAIQTEIEQLMEQRGHAERSISDWLLEKYRLIASQRRGIALAEAKDESCQICHVRLRPQVYSDAKKNEKIITCESCDRILYTKERAIST